MGAEIMKVVYWSDYACPYCYIGEARLKKAIQALNVPVEVEMKAFQLDPSAPQRAGGDTQTRFAHKYGISFEAAGRQIETISRMGRDEGLDFKYATTLFTNTMDAHRLTKLAQTKGDATLTERLIEALFAAYFTDNKELADRGLLQDVGEKAGLDAAEVRELLASNRFEAEVRQDELEAAELGIHGVPFFIVADKYAISGAQSTEGMKEIMLKALKEQRESSSVAEPAMACGPEGCSI